MYRGGKSNSWYWVVMLSLQRISIVDWGELIIVHSMQHILCHLLLYSSCVVFYTRNASQYLIAYYPSHDGWAVGAATQGPAGGLKKKFAWRLMPSLM